MFNDNNEKPIHLYEYKQYNIIHNNNNLGHDPLQIIF